MKRLEVGDEVYVRRGDDKKIRRAVVTEIEDGWVLVRPNCFISGANIWLAKTKHHSFSEEHHYRLVYPYPCIKSLAM